MKFFSISALLLLISVAYSSAQWQHCQGLGWRGTCSPAGNQGHQGPRCPRTRIVWFYDRNNRQCRPMTYMGCGGNSNRWCTREACERTCRR